MPVSLVFTWRITRARYLYEMFLLGKVRERQRSLLVGGTGSLLQHVCDWVYALNILGGYCPHGVGSKLGVSHPITSLG